MTDIEKIARHYGYDKQSNMLMEECAELIQATNKHKRALHDKDGSAYEATENLMEEMADVLLMIDQMLYLLSINPRYIQGIKQRKIQRQLERIGLKNE